MEFIGAFAGLSHAKFVFDLCVSMRTPKFPPLKSVVFRSRTVKLLSITEVAFGGIPDDSGPSHQVGFGGIDQESVVIII